MAKEMTNDRYLFRGRCLNGKGWAFGDLLHNYIHHASGATIINGGGCVYFEVDPETVGLYSGFNDKNDSQMFAGDIFETDRGYKYYIVFENGCFQCYHTKTKDSDGKPYRWGLLSRLFELGEAFAPTVIGNITDNPEILL